MSEQPNVVLGMFIDPVTAYGTSAARITSNHKESESRLLSDAPIDGPIKADEAMAPTGSSNLTAKRVLNSPAGVVLLALPLMYVAFHYAFGA